MNELSSLQNILTALWHIALDSDPVANVATTPDPDPPSRGPNEWRAELEVNLARERAALEDLRAARPSPKEARAEVALAREELILVEQSLVALEQALSQGRAELALARAKLARAELVRAWTGPLED